MLTKQGFRVDVIDDWGQADTLESEWSELLDQTSSPSVFSGFTWAQAWWGTYGHDATPLVLTVRTGSGERGELVGLAPFTIVRDPGKGRFRRLLCIGQDPTYGEYLDVLARRGDEEAVARTFAEQLCTEARRRWDVLAIQRVRDDSSTMAALTRHLEQRSIPVRTSPTASSPFLRLKPSFDEILAERSGNFRRQFRHASNRLAKAGEVEVVVASADPDGELGFDEGFDELLRLHADRWDEAGTFGHASFIGFHRRFGRASLERGELYLALLKLDGVAIAARYDFVFGGKIWCVQGGWDQEHKSLRPGTLMTAEAIRWGIDRGFTEYDFLAGEHDYKRRWADGERGLHAIVAANPATVRGRLYARLRDV